MSQKEKSSFSNMNKWGGCYRKTGHPQTAEEGQGWEEATVSDTLNVFDFSEMRTPILIVEVTNE